MTPSIRRMYYDSEFLPADFTEAGLISIGITDDEECDYYAVNAGMDEEAVRAHPWLRENVWPHIPRTEDDRLDRSHPTVRSTAQLRQGLQDYFAPRHEGERVVLYAYFGAQDLVHLQGLWQHDWGWMPAHIPRWAEDLKALAVRLGNPPLGEFELGGHHALHDARCNRLVRQRLEGSSPTSREWPAQRIGHGDAPLGEGGGSCADSA